MTEQTPSIETKGDYPSLKFHSDLLVRWDCKLANSEAALGASRIELVIEEARLQKTADLLILQAITEGKVDGKNEQARKIQMDSLVDNDVLCQQIQEVIVAFKRKVVTWERQVGTDKAWARYQYILVSGILALMKGTP